MTPLTRTEIEEIKARADAATEGPWIVDRESPGIVRMPAVDEMAGILAGISAPFIAHARTDIPALADTALYWQERCERATTKLNEASWALSSVADEIKSSNFSPADFYKSYAVEIDAFLAEAPKPEGEAT